MSNQRVVSVVEDLEKTMKEFMRKHKITHEEYRIATDIFIQSVKAGEESLLPDVFLEAEATDIESSGLPGGAEAIEGPFYLEGAAELQYPYVMPQRANEKGEVLFFHGTVSDHNGNRLAKAEIDIWHADAEGHYSHIHPDVPEGVLRGRLRTDAEGRFEVRTILPPPYEIPKDGPTGIVLSALGRHFFRPAHLHVKVRSEGCRTHTAQIYFEGDPYLHNDVASAVRDGLVAEVQRINDPGSLKLRGLSEPYAEVKYDFVLNRI